MLKIFHVTNNVRHRICNLLYFKPCPHGCLIRRYSHEIHCFWFKLFNSGKVFANFAK